MAVDLEAFERRVDEALAKLLNVPMYKDKSGYNFPKFRTHEKAKRK